MEALQYDSHDGFDGAWAHQHETELTIDIAVLGDAVSAKSILLHTSGTHGVEGYAGSAIQSALLPTGHGARIPATAVRRATLGRS